MSDPFNPYAPPQSNIIPASHPDEVQQIASPWRRLGASLLDALIMVILFLPIMWIGGYFTHIMERGPGSLWSVKELLCSAAGFGFMLAVNWNHLGRGQTIGKGIMALRIVRQNGTPAERSHIILKRLLPLQLIAELPILGSLFVIVDCLSIFRSQHITFHDDIADTKVIDLRSRPAV